MGISDAPLAPRDREAIYYERYESALGSIYLVLIGEDLVAIEFERPHMRVGQAPGRLKAELEGYFEGSADHFTHSVRLLCGTDFEQRVWLALRKIPFGETRTYKWLAEEVGCPQGTRAVGQALAKNPVPIVLPCHRVIESTGKLGGYSGGEDIKRRLLSMEYYHRPAAESN